ncbi:MAG TPA: TonB-dependent receptor [Pedobacter sp.]|nr:TonB-dependent receptor [Pedobacter sp.]
MLCCCGIILSAQEQPDTIKLQEVGIKGKRSLVGHTSISTTLHQRQLETTRGSALGEVLKSIAGVSVLKTGATIAKPVIHGLHSNRILILNNGVRLEGQAWGAEHAPEIDPMIAERMQLIKGAESVRYGAEAIGGLVMVIPPDLPVEPGIGGSIHTIGSSNGRSFSTSAMLNGALRSLPGFSWRVQGSYKKAGNIKTADYYLGNTGLREFNYSAALGYISAKAGYEVYYSQFSTNLGILYSAHAGTLEDIAARIAAGRPVENYDFTYAVTAPRQRILHHLAKVKAHYDLSDHQSMEVIYGFQRNHRREFDFRRGDREALPITDLVLNTHTLNLELKQQRDSNFNIAYGFNSVVQVNNNVPGTLANTFIPNYDSFTGGLFLVQKWTGKLWELEAGLRYDFKLFDAAGYRYQYNSSDTSGGITEEYYGGQRQFHNVTGSLGAHYKLSAGWQLASNLALAWRAPTANELFSNGLHHGAGLYEVGDPNLKSEQGYKWINSIKYLSGQLSIELDAYAQYIDNYIYTRPGLSYRQAVGGTYPIFRYQQTNASFMGIDFSAVYRVLAFLSYRINAAAVRAKDLNADQYLPYIPSDRIDQSLRLDFNFRALSESYLQLGHGYVARQTRYEPGSDYTEPPPAYHLFSLMAGSTYQTGRQQLGINAGVDNLFNKGYREYMNRYRYYTHDIGRNISLRLVYKF